jgi:hypothetical protein
MLKIQCNNLPLDISIYEDDDITTIEVVFKKHIYNLNANDIIKNIE